MQYDIKKLKALDVYSLRIVAREIGVKAPTKLDKQELLDEIVLIKSGMKAPVSPTKRGRPLKSKIYPCAEEPESKTTDKEVIKQALIASILKEIEKKLNEIL